MKEIENTLSKLYHSLRAARRRYLIQYLSKVEREAVTTRELARKISSLEEDCSVQRATGEPYRNVYNALSQTHLPTLAEAGVIVYDPERQTVTTGPNFAVASLLVTINKPTVETFYAMAHERDTDP